MTKMYWIVALVACLLLTTGTVRADEPKPFLHPLFMDNMVLQRGIADPVWGWAAPGQSVVVKVVGAGMKARMSVAVAGADGKWMVHLPPIPVGGPYEMTVTGQDTVTLHNILVGDIWLCSGQSNMQFGIGNAINADAEIAKADFPNIRLFTVPQTVSDTPRATTVGKWQPCSPETIKTQGTWGGFSAVGYFFGRDLYQKLKVPIGLIESDWGGTPAEAWASEPALRKMPDFVPILDQMASTRKSGANFEDLFAEWYGKNDPGTDAHWESPSFDDSAWTNINAPGLFQDAGIPELTGINGVIWYRKTFDMPADEAGKAATLHLLVDDDDTTWVNGREVGATRGYLAPRAYTLPAGLLKPTANVVVVRVLDTGGKGGIWGDPSGLSVKPADGAPISLVGQWKIRLGVNLAKATAPPAQMNQNLPSALYNGMISPLIPYGLTGAIWYQGESNAGKALQYRTLLPTMIRDWRQRWGKDFPFLVVQLANWGPGGQSWADLREAQWLTATTLPHVGIATAIDVGDHADIHPKNKQEVSRRLALVAQAQVYGEKVEYSGPIYQNMALSGGSIRLTFAHIGGGLVAKDGKPLTGFTIAGADGNFVPADAAIDGETVVVSSPMVTMPTAVRYAWASDPECSLFNKAGLPAFPFGTDQR